MEIKISGTNKKTVIDELNKYLKDSKTKKYKVTDFGQYEEDKKIFYYFCIVGLFNEIG